MKSAQWRDRAGFLDMSALVLVVCLAARIMAEKPEQSLCAANFTCISLRECRAKPHRILYPCHSGLNLFCCPNEDILRPDKINAFSARSSFFPVNCGVLRVDNKIIGGQEAGYGQFPWMALLGYTQKNGPMITEFLCGGTLITDKHVLTAAHCIIVSASHKLVTVRLGEHNLKTERDCYVTNKITVCAAPHSDYEVEAHAIHPNYHEKALKNDIALVKIKFPVQFTEYVQPICLPFERDLDSRSLAGQRFIISGWGKTDAKKLGGSATLQYASVTVWDSERCSQVMPPEVKDISDTQICANSEKMDACKGDSGGPMANTTLDVDGELRTFQIGIVSFATTLTCGVSELPPIYTRVDRYLDWIVATITKTTDDDSSKIHFENK